MVTGPGPGVDLNPYENIDRLLNVELRIAKAPMGIVGQLYRHVRGELPLSYQIGRALLDRPGARIGFVTGVYLPPYFPAGEIDGPIGGLVFARVLGQLGYPVLLLMEQQVIEATRPLGPVAGATAVQFHDGNRLGPRDIARLVDELDVVIASERLGSNAKGVRHTINGTRADLPSPYPWPDELVRAMNRAGKLTIGIGDGGNEIGFGKIYEFARQVVPNGQRCRCPCMDGIVTATATGLLFPVNVSNFGVYGLIAALGLATRRPELLHDAATERALLAAAIRSGFVDGGTGLPEEAEDGVPGSGAAAFVALLQALVANALRDFVRPF